MADRAAQPTAVCPKCSRELPLAQFASDRWKASGHKSWCKSCDNAKSRAYYEANYERKLAYMAVQRAAARAQLPPKWCERCGERETVTRRHRYCAACRNAPQRTRRGRKVTTADRARWAKKAAKRGTATEQGYGPAHVKLRERVARQMEAVWAAGNAVPCARGSACLLGGWIRPGQPWDLGHDDHDRSRYRGPEHRRCNRATSGRRKRRVSVTSRRW